MIRFAWLQARTQAVVAVGVLAVVAVVLGVTGPNIVHLYDTTVATCAAHNDCQAATAALSDADGPVQVFADFLLLLVPVLIGMFWGAPLVAREFETGTFRLAWTQGVTRTRWLAIKLALGAVASMVVAGLLSLMVTWWSSPFDRVSMDPFNSLSFGIRDIVPVGYAAFAFVLGFAAGLVARRTLPAMATALVGFVAAREVMTSWVRPYLIAPLQKAVAINPAFGIGIEQTPTGIAVSAPQGGGVLPGTWVYSTRIVDNAGHAPTQAFLGRACPFNKTSGQPNPQTCIANVAAKFHEVVTYQPASRYWAFQWDETAVFLGLAALLGAVCFWWIRRPVA